MKRLALHRGCLAGLLAVVLLALPQVALAEDAITTLRVEGNRRIESLAIIRSSGLQVGDLLTPEKAAQAIRSIYALGAFRDIQVWTERTSGGVALVFQVTEHPVVSKVLIEGNKKIDEEKIREVLDLKAFTVLDRLRLERNRAKVQDLYTEKGFYLAHVVAEVRDNSIGEVDVAFVISEGRKVLIRRVEIIGNVEKKDSAIKRFLETKEAGILGGLSEKGAFKEGAVQDDAGMVEAFYQEFGYLDIKVSEPQVHLSPDRRWVTVRIHVEEGKHYKVGAISVAGDLMMSSDELLALTHIEEGDDFQRSTISEDVQTLTDVYTDVGYAFANVIPLTRKSADSTEDQPKVDIIYNIQQGDLARLGKILITGNDRTWDKTIRREIPLVEGQQWKGSAVREARRRIERLGYFEDVNITTPKGEEADELDLHVDVEEKATGTFSVGAGFSQIEKFSFNGQVSRDNFLGLGFNMSAVANIALGSKNKNGPGRIGQSQTIQFSFSDPRFLDSKWSASFNVFTYNRTYPFNEFQRGFSLSFGRWLNPGNDLRFFVEYRLNASGLTRLSEHQIRLFGGQLYRSGTASSFSFNMSYDRRDNRLLPTKGMFANAAVELAGGFRANPDTVVDILGGKFRFIRLQGNIRLYYPLFTIMKVAPIVARFNLTAGMIRSTDGTIVPISLRYRAGGINSLRGHYQLTLGPSVLDTASSDLYGTITDRIVGGTWSVIANTEIEFPLVPPAGLRGVVFLDAGNAFGGLSGSERATVQDIRWSAGFGVRWQSPMGPMRFEWGFPLDRRSTERKSVFEFTIGSFF